MPITENSIFQYDKDNPEEVYTLLQSTNEKEVQEIQSSWFEEIDACFRSSNTSKLHGIYLNLFSRYKEDAAVDAIIFVFKNFMLLPPANQSALLEVTKEQLVGLFSYIINHFKNIIVYHHIQEPKNVPISAGVIIEISTMLVKLINRLNEYQAGKNIITEVFAQWPSVISSMYDKMYQQLSQAEKLTASSLMRDFSKRIPLDNNNLGIIIVLVGRHLAEAFMSQTYNMSELLLAIPPEINDMKDDSVFGSGSIDFLMTALENDKRFTLVNIYGVKALSFAKRDFKNIDELLDRVIHQVKGTAPKPRSAHKKDNRERDIEKLSKIMGPPEIRDALGTKPTSSRQPRLLTLKNKSSLFQRPGMKAPTKPSPIASAKTKQSRGSSTLFPNQVVVFTEFKQVNGEIVSAKKQPS